MLPPGFFSFQHSYAGEAIGLSFSKSLIPKLLWLHTSICKKKKCGACTHIINVYLYISCIYALLYNIQLTPKQQRSTYNRGFFLVNSVPPGLAFIDSTNHWWKTVIRNLWLGIHGCGGPTSVICGFSTVQAWCPYPHPPHCSRINCVLYNMKHSQEEKLKRIR